MSEIDKLQIEIFSQRIVKKLEDLEKKYQNAKGYERNSIYPKLQKYRKDLKKIKGDIHVN